MAKRSGSKPLSNGGAEGSAPVLNLTIDGSFPEAEVRDATPSADDGFKTPCSISGVMAGASGGALGYAFGFGERSIYPPPPHSFIATELPHPFNSSNFYSLSSPQSGTGCGSGCGAPSAAPSPTAGPLPRCADPSFYCP